MMPDPETLLMVGVIGGLAAAGTLLAFKFAEGAGPLLSPEDLLPMPPPYPPVPRFMYTKPGLPTEMRRR